MAKVIVNILIKSIGIYFRSNNIYLSGEIQDPIIANNKTYEPIGSKISVTVERNTDNLFKVSQLLTGSWKLAYVEVDVDSRTKTEEKFGKHTYRYNSLFFDLPAICEPLTVKS